MSDELESFWTFDFETDPFRHERIPLPFCVGAYNGVTGEYLDCWGDQETVVDFIVSVMEANPGQTFFAHNGGKFDFHYLKEFLDLGDLKVISARIAECFVAGARLRDSYLMIPVPLSKYEKTEIDYDKMEAECREEHKEEIMSYMRDDCVNLWDLIDAFIKEFGLKLTMAGAAMEQLERFHDYERITGPGADKMFRRFYYGGRVSCLQSGILKGDWKIYDVNSMYPHVMRDFEHPISREYITYTGKHANTILERCDFAHIDAYSKSALPYVENEGTYDEKLTFPVGRREFFATGHEIRAGLETGRLKVFKVLRAYKAEQHTTFAEFIEHFYQARLDAKKRGDKLHDLFYKLVMNSSYGKFAQNPDDFRDWVVTDEEFPEGTGWRLECDTPGGLMIWSRPTSKPAHFSRYNVMTAASITGAARAQLLRGLNMAQNPVYCDTDSIICEGFSGDLDDSRLGAWALEATGDQIAIAGKKTYALTANGQLVKKASKGVNLPADEIIAAANGEIQLYENEAPTFNLKKPTRFIKRKVRNTADASSAF